MFTGKVEVMRLTERAITLRMINEMNVLLRRQRGDADKITRESLQKRLENRAAFIALDDREAVVGMAMLSFGGGFNFDYAEICQVIIADGYDFAALATRLLEKIQTVHLHTHKFIEAGRWVQHQDYYQVLRNFGFKEKPGNRYRLRLKIPAVVAA